MGYNIKDSPCLDTNITETCDFLIANGTCLFIIGLLGTIMSSFTIYCLIFHVKLPYCQNFFILNVAVSDILIAVVGIFRGLGILDANYVGIDDNGILTWWCYMYTIMANSIWMAAIPVLVPLTFDRFVAVVFSLHYKRIINTFTAKIMVALTWIPILMLLMYDSITYAKGTTEIAYQKNYHRCVIETNRSWKPVIFLITPFLTILAMYVAILFFVKRAGAETKKLLIMSTAIIGTGLIAYTPDTLLITFKVTMTYEAAQITTVTLYYMNSIWNPIIYFCTNRYTRRDLAEFQSSGRPSLAVVSCEGYGGPKLLRSLLPPADIKTYVAVDRRGPYICGPPLNNSATTMYYSATKLGRKIVKCVYGEEGMYTKGRSSTAATSDLPSSSHSAKATYEVSVAKGNEDGVVRVE